MSSHRGGMAGRSVGVVKLLPIICYGVVAHRQHHVFDGGVAGDRSRPPALAGGVANWQSGQANGLECVLLPRNCPLVNSPNETMSAKTLLP